MTESEEMLELITQLIVDIGDTAEEEVFENFELMVRAAKISHPRPVAARLVPQPRERPTPWTHFGQNLPLLKEMLERSGRALPFSRMTTINNSLQRLSWQLQTSVTFFGWAQSARGDCLLACQPPRALPPGEKALAAAERELNELRFFVAGPAATAEWVELPRVTRRMVREARKARHQLRGELQAAGIDSFSGCEGQWLRCQLLRIVCASWVVPKGAATLNEDGRLDLDAEFKLTAEDAVVAESQLHRFPHLRAEGGLSSLRSAEENERMDQLLKQAEEADPPVPPLRALSEENAGLWRVTSFVDKAYLGPPPERANAPVVAWENLNWPGSVNLFDLQRGHWAFFYVGRAQKAQQDLIPACDLIVTNDGGEEPIPEPEPTPAEEEPQAAEGDEPGTEDPGVREEN